MARNRIPVKVAGGFDWVDVRDVVQGAVSAGELGLRGRKYPLSGHWCSLADVADMVAAAMGRSAPRLHVPLAVARGCSPVVERLGRWAGRSPIFTPYSIDALCHHRCVSHERASVELGYTPRALEQTIGDTCRWFAEHGFLTGMTPSEVGAR